MNLKDQILDDIKSVFLDKEEFAEDIDFEDQTLTVSMEVNAGREALEREDSSLNTFKWDRRFSVDIRDIHRKPEPGDLVRLNGGEYQHVVKTDEEMGMYIVYLTGNEA
ncbi:MAG: hypothetical protein ACRDBM_12340 [Sporomusa sp.]